MENISIENEEREYDKHVDFYYTNLINSIILFSLTKKELEKLARNANGVKFIDFNGRIF